MTTREWSTREFTTRSEAETEALGAEIGRRLTPPVWIGLRGDLGAGKTRLAAGVVRGLGYEGRVRSPTYVLENRYQGRVEARHLDLYRLEGSADDLEEGWDDPQSVVLVEWAERVSAPPARAIWIDIEGAGEAARSIRVSWPDDARVLSEDLSEVRL